MYKDNYENCKLVFESFESATLFFWNYLSK